MKQAWMFILLLIMCHNQTEPLYYFYHLQLLTSTSPDPQRGKGSKSLWRRSDGENNTVTMTTMMEQWLECDHPV